MFLSFLILIGVMLIAEGAGTHMNKGYIYFAMAFAIIVEQLIAHSESLTGGYRGMLLPRPELFGFALGPGEADGHPGADQPRRLGSNGPHESTPSLAERQPDAELGGALAVDELHPRRHRGHRRHRAKSMAGLTSVISVYSVAN